jgi:hypothetical protein
MTKLLTYNKNNKKHIIKTSKARGLSYMPNYIIDIESLKNEFGRKTKYYWYTTSNAVGYRIALNGCQ